MLFQDTKNNINSNLRNNADEKNTRNQVVNFKQK